MYSVAFSPDGTRIASGSVDNTMRVWPVYPDRRGDRDAAIPLMRTATDHSFREGRLLAWTVPVTGVLVETLLDRGTESDVAEAEAAIDRLAAAQGDEGLVISEIWFLRMRALLARAYGDDASYREYRDRYRAMATSLGFEGHMKWAEAMPIQAGLVVFTLVVTVSPTVAPTVVPPAVPVRPPVDPSGPVDACGCIPPRAADADTGIC